MTGRSAGRAEKRPVSFTRLTPEELIGPLNDVERVYAPAELFVQGRMELAKRHPRVSIVGSRAATDMGLRRARRIARLLAKNGVVVVSGLATGIDTAAHDAAISSGGDTIGVIGTPLDRAYPKESAVLQERIAKEHLLVSQFPLGSAVHRGNFPQRNRTMALLCEATLIVEAQDRSGSLHQGWEALRLGRALVIMESSAKDERLTWPSEFLKYGAMVLTEDSLDAFNEILPPITQDRSVERAAF